jgi:hypothetical protein
MRRIPQVLAVLYYSLDDGGAQTAHAAVHVFVLVQRLLIPRDKEEAAMMKKASPDQVDQLEACRYAVVADVWDKRTAALGSCSLRYNHRNHFSPMTSH